MKTYETTGEGKKAQENVCKAQENLGKPKIAGKRMKTQESVGKRTKPQESVGKRKKTQESVENLRKRKRLQENKKERSVCKT